MSRKRYSIAVDFDGVIHRYGRGWHDGTIYDEPVPGAREALARIHRGYRVVILTTRVNPALHGGDAQLASVEAWLEQHGFVRGEHWDEVTHEKVPALVYIDDRALHFTDWNQALAELGQRYRLP
jgi:ribonucleotide monophosphatase NagD (HAD superfamily)